jgi:hypothetical protein
MGALQVVRWRRFGHDRLYVNDPNGARLGEGNLKDGRIVIAAEERRAEVEAAIRGHDLWLDTGVDPGSSVTGPCVGPVPAPACPTDPTRSPEAAWTDLALNTPGESARAQALQHRHAAPVRTFLARILGLHTEERAWRIGADGERAVGKKLDRLPQAWHALHAVPVGTRGADIDHVLIGPGGVFTINTKNHPRGHVRATAGAVYVAGQPTKYVAKSRHEASRAADRLSAAAGSAVRVTPVLVILCPRLTTTAPTAGVVVLHANGLRRWIARRGTTLGPDRIETLYQLARRSTTWQPPP